MAEILLEVPIEYEQNVCGELDAYLKKIERSFHVSIFERNGDLKIIGDDANCDRAASVFNSLIELAKRGNTIMEQNVDYAIALSMESREKEIVEIDKDIICRTIMGKPVKPKTLGQKEYVDSIRKNMITFGIGPAGTGKTYLAMAMAITAFKNETFLPLYKSRLSC